MKKSWKILVLLPLISSCSFNISVNFGSTSDTSISISSGDTSSSSSSSSIISSSSSSESISSSISSSIDPSLIEEAGATSFLDAEETQSKRHLPRH